jgi:hypothetical protein
MESKIEKEANELFEVGVSKKELFYLIGTEEWNWTKTDSTGYDTEQSSDYGDDPAYDYTFFSGRLFSCETDCPICGGQSSLHVTSGLVDWISAPAKDWVCLSCGNGGDIVGQHGEGDISPRFEGDDDYYLVPRCIIVSVEE